MERNSLLYTYGNGTAASESASDRTMQEHHQQLSECPLDPGNGVGNGQLNDSHSGATASDTGSGSAGSSAASESTPIFHGGNLTDRPKHERFASESVREKTFATWSSHRAQNPVNLAKAGFFYAGFSDNVRCFFCNGGIRNWEPQGDPWTEHARWFPWCGFVRQCKGEEFIRHVKGLYPRHSNDTPPQLTSQNQVSRANIRRREAKEENERSEKKEKSTDAALNVSESDERDKSLPYLKAENQRLKSQMTCKICMTEEASVVFLPCGHLVSCTQCAPAPKSCPVCRASIRDTLRANIA